VKLSTRKVAVLAVAIAAATSMLLVSGTVAGASSRSNAKASKAYVIGVSNGYYGNAARVELQAAMKAYAALPSVKPKIAKLVINNAGTSVAKQIAAVDAMIAQKVDAIILDSNSLNGLNKTIATAVKAGIPVIAVNDQVSSKLAYHVETVGEKFGATMARGFVAMLKGKGNIVVLRGLAGNAVDAAEARGFYGVLNKYPNIKRLNESYGLWDDGNAQKIMSDLLARYDNIDGVYTEGGMQQGVVRAYVAAHRDFVPVVGTDENGFACQIKQYYSQGLRGYQVGTAIYAYALALRNILAVLDGKTVPKFIPISFSGWGSAQAIKLCRTDVSPSLFLQVSYPKAGIFLTPKQVDKYMR
jgi:ribose transport system substrate-binding protein